MNYHISIAELYAIRDAKSMETLRQRLFDVLSGCGSCVCSSDSVHDLISLHREVDHPDIARAIGFAREALDRLRGRPHVRS